MARMPESVTEGKKKYFNGSRVMYHNFHMYVNLEGMALSVSVTGTPKAISLEGRMPI